MMTPETSGGKIERSRENILETATNGVELIGPVMAEAVKAGNLDSFQPTLVEDRATPPRADGNNVSVDLELAAINKNALMHQMAIQLMQTKLAMQRTAITGQP